MTNLALVQNQTVDGVELKISRLQELRKSIKALEAEFEMIKKDLLNGHFSIFDEYSNENGLLLASYKASIRVMLNQKELEKNDKSTYDKYLELKTIKTFLLK